MTVKTTIEFTTDLESSLDAAVEAVRLAAIRITGRTDLRNRLGKMIQELHEIKREAAQGSIHEGHLSG